MAIRCMNLTVAASGEFRFKVEGYSFTKEAVTSECEYYQSDLFRVGLQDWAVRYYPKKGGPGKFQVALVLVSPPAQAIAVRFVLTPLCRLEFPSDKMKVVTAANVDCVSASLVFQAREVLSLALLHAEMTEFVMEDSFVLQCTVSVLKRPRSGSSLF